MSGIVSRRNDGAGSTACAIGVGTRKSTEVSVSVERFDRFLLVRFRTYTRRPTNRQPNNETVVRRASSPVAFSASFQYLTTHRRTSIPFFYAHKERRAKSRVREDKKVGKGVEERLEARARPTRRNEGEGEGRAKKSEAVEGKKEDSRRFNTR